jgi:hypothetical protein
MDRSFETGGKRAGDLYCSLGLIYHSMALYQLQSRDTVSLKRRQLMQGAHHHLSVNGTTKIGGAEIFVIGLKFVSTQFF